MRILGAEGSRSGRGKVGRWRGAGEGSRGIRSEGGGLWPKNRVPKVLHGRVRATAGIGLMAVRKVFFHRLKKYIFMANIELTLNRLRVNPFIED